MAVGIKPLLIEHVTSDPSKSNKAGLKRIFLRVKNWITYELSLIIFLLLWEAAPRLGIVKQTFIAPPSVVLITIWEMIKTGELFRHVGVSFERAIIGFFLATLVAIPLGFFLGGWYKTFKRVATPLLRLLQELNPFALFPIFMMLFGIGEVSKVAMIFWVCQWPILFHTINGVESVDPLLIKSARSMGIDKKTLILKVILPSALPNIFTGLKIGSATAFFMLIAAEMIGASSGLGWLVWNAQINFQIPKLFAASVIISVLGLLINLLFIRLEHRLLGWKEATFGQRQ